MGKVFEEICKQYLWKLLLEGKSAVDFTDIGRWWGTNPATHGQEEIDLVAKEGKDYIFGECKWRNEKIDISVLHGLKEKADILILAGGGHEKFARYSGIKYEENTLYKDSASPIMMDIETRKKETERYYKSISLDEIPIVRIT